MRFYQLVNKALELISTRLFYDFFLSTTQIRSIIYEFIN